MTKPPKGETYLCFTEGYDLVEAVSRFLKRFAHTPRFVWLETRMIRVGPVEKENNDRSD